jgi:hypothetical protein
VVASPPSPAAPEAYALAYDEAKRALEEQDRVVTELRSRAGVLMAAAAITTSFLGDRILSGSHVHPLAWIAIGCFVALGLTVLILLWPWRDWKFTINAQSFIQSYLEPEDDDPLDLAAIHRDLALHMAASWKKNERQLRWLFVAFRVAAMLLVGEIVFWVLALATRS